MQPLSCETCQARVAVAKYSPAHTSIQWNDQAAARCQELAAAASVPDGNYLLRCSALDRSIDASVARGEVDLSLRTDPRVLPLGTAPSGS